MLGLEGLNWLAVIVAAIVYFVVGFVWYGPLFGKQWAAGMGMDTSDMKPEPMKLGLVALMGLFVSIALAALLNATATADLASALVRTFLAWAGFVAATSASEQIMDTRPWNLWGINKGYHLVAMLAAALVLTFMG